MPGFHASCAATTAAQSENSGGRRSSSLSLGSRRLRARNVRGARQCLLTSPATLKPCPSLWSAFASLRQSTAATPSMKRSLGHKETDVRKRPGAANSGDTAKSLQAVVRPRYRPTPAVRWRVLPVKDSWIARVFRPKRFAYLTTSISPGRHSFVKNGSSGL